MKRNWLHLLICIIGGAALQIVFPWWSWIFIALISAYLLKLKKGAAFLFGLFSGIILWGGLALFIDIQNAHILSARMGELFNGIGTTGLIIITSLLGGLFAGISSLFGASLYSNKKG